MEIRTPHGRYASGQDENGTAYMEIDGLRVPIDSYEVYTTLTLSNSSGGLRCHHCTHVWDFSKLLEKYSRANFVRKVVNDICLHFHIIHSDS